MNCSKFLHFSALFLCLSFRLVGQSLEPSWSYTYEETTPGKQIIFFTPLNSGSDGSVAFVVTRGGGAGGGLENRVFWLRSNKDGSSPTSPIWSSEWTASGSYTDVVAVRRNLLVYSSGRELNTVRLSEDGRVEEPILKKTFAGETEGGDPLVFSVEQARTPGVVFSVATRKDKLGFTLSAFQFTPAPPELSAVPTFTTISEGNLSISFRAEEGANYQLQSSTDLTAASWQNVGSVFAGDGELKTILQSTTAENVRLFFRVISY